MKGLARRSLRNGRDLWCFASECREHSEESESFSTRCSRNSPLGTLAKCIDITTSKSVRDSHGLLSSFLRSVFHVPFRCSHKNSLSSRRTTCRACLSTAVEERVIFGKSEVSSELRGLADYARSKTRIRNFSSFCKVYKLSTCEISERFSGRLTEIYKPRKLYYRYTFHEKSMT